MRRGKSRTAVASLGVFFNAGCCPAPALSPWLHIPRPRSPTLPHSPLTKIITMSVLRLRSALAPLSVRRFATAAPSVSVTSTRSNASAPILGNIEASWKTLPAEEQYEVYQQLEQLQKKNWKELTIDEKKAGELFICSF